MRAAALLLLALGCTPKPPATTAPTQLPLALAAGGTVLVGAGDIASCENDDDEATAQLVEQVLRMAPGAQVFTLGDNAYERGTAHDFEACYAPTWGRFKDRTHPAVGNHEYKSPDAAPYFAYFGKAAGDAGKGWYSWEAGPWHVVVLNSNCEKVGCARDSEQMQWLAADLDAHASRCTLAYWHHPFISSGSHGNDDALKDAWQILEDRGVDLVLAGHDHDYERFAPVTGTRGVDDKNGMREIIVGSGGRSHYEIKKTERGSEASNTEHYGVLVLELFDDHYRFRFLGAGGAVEDQGEAACR